MQFAKLLHFFKSFENQSNIIGVNNVAFQYT
jgi:hypothetical protein